jgi:hypothetical protein
MNGVGGSVFTLEDGRTVEAMEIGQVNFYTNFLKATFVSIHLTI